MPGDFRALGKHRTHKQKPNGKEVEHKLRRLSYQKREFITEDNSQKLLQRPLQEIPLIMSISEGSTVNWTLWIFI